VPVPVARAEDIVVMKILAERPKDIEDVVSILAAHPDLDLDLVRSTLRLLEEALDQSDLLPALERARQRARKPGPPAKSAGVGAASKRKRKPRAR
jgi:hypothetical protein